MSEVNLNQLQGYNVILIDTKPLIDYEHRNRNDNLLSMSSNLENFFEYAINNDINIWMTDRMAEELNPKKRRRTRHIHQSRFGR